MSKAARASKKRAQQSAREALRHRIALAFRLSGRVQSDVARELGVDGSRVSRWFNPDDRQGEVPGPDYLPLLPELLGVDGHWLLTGDGPMTRHEPRARRLAADSVERARRVALDRIERALREMRNGDG